MATLKDLINSIQEKEAHLKIAYDQVKEILKGKKGLEILIKIVNDSATELYDFPVDITTVWRKREFSDARKVYFELASRFTNNSQEQIIEAINHKNHSSVIAGRRTHKMLMQTSSEYRMLNQVIIQNLKNHEI